MKLFENLSTEKPTSLFLSLAKNKTSGTGLGKIKNDNDSPFDNDEMRNNYITNFYENLYKKDPAEPQNFDNIIEEFLGPEILNSNVVSASKLTEQEVNSMELPISLAELDLSLKEGNAKSAPGMDGMGMPVIKKIWNYIRHPLQKYANHCFETGTLTENFRGACIRLIPKKSDAKYLKNWRPISLLSNLYKLISRVINNRLNSVVNRICSRAQKGFNCKRYTQEAIINVWESIAHCRKNNIKGAILAIDMAKAFDTVSINFVEAVYKFFGFGPIMRRWLALLGTDRFACIILEEGKMSRKFKLGRGRPQGDIISPNTFNFVAQILIFKLELDSRIKKIPRVVPVQIIANNQSCFMYESNRETDKNESLADDNTTITMLDLESLQAARQILEDFGNISGLRCNYDKSVIMPISEISEAEILITQTLGFSIQPKITLLGVEISNKLDNLREITCKTKEKIISLIAFWERFRLSLPGRIAILKTCLISQLCYLGSFLPLDEAILDEIQILLDNFIKKNLKIAQSRIYLPAAYGGVGAIHIRSFLTALNLSWFSRAHSLCIDNWRYDLHANAYSNNIILAQAEDLDQAEHPILFHMVKNYNLFYARFTELNGNYKSAYIYNNEAFRFGPDGSELFNKRFFGLAFFEANQNRIRNLTFDDLFHDGRVRSLADFTASGLHLSVASWMRLQLAAISIRNRLRKLDETDLLVDNIGDFLRNIKKGSKKFRTVLSMSSLSNANPNGLRIVNTFATSTGTQIPVVDITKLALSSWNLPFLHNSFKDFIFKFRNNQLYTNDRLHAIDGLTDPGCTFCRIRGNFPASNETIRHFFLECPTTMDFVTRWCRQMDPAPNFLNNDDVTLYWYGGTDINNDCKYLTFLFDSFRYIIWNFKLRKKLPNFNMLERELNFFVWCSANSNQSFKRKLLNINRVLNMLPARG